MNKLIFPNGGLPLYGDDFSYMQDSLRKAMTASLLPYAALNGGNMVVSGCVMNFNNVTQTFDFTEGWVMIDYDLLWFRGGDSGEDNAADIFDIEVEPYIYADPNANATRTLANGNSANVWQRREARFRQTPNLIYLAIALNSNRLPYLAAKLLEGAADTDVALTGFDNNWGGGNIISPRAIRRGNTVILRGLLSVGTVNTTNFNLVFTLQLGYRPKVRQYFTCAMPNSSIGLVDILQDGSVYVKYLLENTTDPPSLLDISNIRYEGA
jgi:hypothetical protein